MPSMLDGQRSGIGSLAKLGEGVRANSDAKTQAGLSRGAGQSKKLVNAAWTQTFPAQGATLDLDFANDIGFVRGVGQGRSMDAVTFIRASNGTFVKPDGTLAQHSNQGALGLNLLTFPQDFDNAAWADSATNRTTITANTATAPNESLTADLFSMGSDTNPSALHARFQSVTIVAGSAYTYTAYVKTVQDSIFPFVLFGTQDATNGAIYSWFSFNTGLFSTVGVGHTTNVTALSKEWFRIQITYTYASVTTARVWLGMATTNGAIGATGVQGSPAFFAWGAQLELGSTATEYFPTNINTPRFDWASTTSTGVGTIANPFVIPLVANSTSNGLLIEESRANRILWCRDATQTNWVKLNVTAAKDQTGVDGVASSASLLTATSANGTCIQTITLASGSRTGSVFLKRIIGTGDIQVTLDGTTYSTVDLSNGIWNRIVISATVLNPVVGIRIVTSGDAVAMDFGQVEDGAFVTSPIMTTTASVTRAAEATAINLTNSISILDYQSGTCLVNFKPITTPIGTGNNIINAGTYFSFFGNTANRFGLTTSANNSNGLDSAIFPLIDNIIAASWASTGVKRSSNAGVFDERFVTFVPVTPQNFQRLAALNSTTKRVIYYPFQVSITELQTLTGGAT